MGDNVSVCTGGSDIPADFKSTLPPRKRAKTQEEKEQRRIERILRNRRAAHHSREKKRLHLQVLEHKCLVMEQILGKIGNLEELIGGDDEGRALIKEYTNVSGECGSPKSSYSPESVAKPTSEEIKTPTSQLKESSDFLTAIPSSSESTSSSSFSPNMALTPVSFVKDESDGKNWDLLLTSEDNTYTTGAITTNIQSVTATQQDDNGLFPQLWLPFDGTEESSFELDDWRNPAVITATTSITTY